MIAPPEKPRAQRLQEAQQRAARLRSEAFVDYAPEVCGVRLQPITWDSFNALKAFGNGFITGESITFLDIVNFIWIHHPDFGQFNREAKARNTRAVYRALVPRFSGFNELMWFASQLPRFRWLRFLRRPRESVLLADAIAEIRRLVHEALHDMPSGEEKSEPMPYSFQAYMLNAMRRHLGMAFEETRRMPMRQLVEHYRELIDSRSGGKALLLTREEEQIWADDLAAKTAKAKANKAAAEAKAAADKSKPAQKKQEAKQRV